MLFISLCSNRKLIHPDKGRIIENYGQGNKWSVLHFQRLPLLSIWRTNFTRDGDFTTETEHNYSDPGDSWRSQRCQGGSGKTIAD